MPKIHHVTRKTAVKKDRSNEIFGEIVSGLVEAADYAKGTANKKAFRVHIPEKIDVRAIRKGLKMSQDVFARHFGFSVARVRDWEQGRSSPDQAVRAYLRIIEEEPELVGRVLAAA
ncbi:MAG TPA: helix-turn-helix domain-containing protein [Rhizomicrobium sp.]|nr:helix-turn-helix domain-containing protein [Rhizomicrobium sp.]